MKKIIALLLAMVMVLAMFTACGSKTAEAPAAEEPAAEEPAAEEPAAEEPAAEEPAEEEPAAEAPAAELTIDEIKAQLQTVEDGKLTVATSPDFAPYEFYSLDEDGNPTLAGFDMALAQYIADFLGLELEVIPMDFDGTLAELAAKTVDLSMAGYSPDPEREDKMDFSEIYYTGGQSFVTVQDKASLFASLADANNPDYSIGAQIGSIQVGLAEENTPDADIVQLSTVTDIIA